MTAGLQDQASNPLSSIIKIIARGGRRLAVSVNITATRASRSKETSKVTPFCQWFSCVRLRANERSLETQRPDDPTEIGSRFDKRQASPVCQRGYICLLPLPYLENQQSFRGKMSLGLSDNKPVGIKPVFSGNKRTRRFVVTHFRHKPARSPTRI